MTQDSSIKVTGVKGLVHLQPKNEKCCHHLLNLKLFQTCMSFFLLLNTNEDILKNVGNQTIADGSHFGSCFLPHNKTDGDNGWGSSTCYQHSSQYLYFC